MAGLFAVELESVGIVVGELVLDADAGTSVVEEQAVGHTAEVGADIVGEVAAVAGRTVRREAAEVRAGNSDSDSERAPAVVSVSVVEEAQALSTSSRAALSIQPPGTQARLGCGHIVIVVAVDSRAVVVQALAVEAVVQAVCRFGSLAVMLLVTVVWAARHNHSAAVLDSYTARSLASRAGVGATPVHHALHLSTAPADAIPHPRLPASEASAAAHPLLDPPHSPPSASAAAAVHHPAVAAAPARLVSDIAPAVLAK